MARNTGRGSRLGVSDGRFLLAKSHGGDFSWTYRRHDRWWRRLARTFGFGR